jgi:hypothetical protein
MEGEAVQMSLVLDTRDEDQERAEEDLQYLSDELVQIDGVSIERESIGPPPPGTRGAGEVAAPHCQSWSGWYVTGSHAEAQVPSG